MIIVGFHNSTVRNKAAAEMLEAKIGLHTRFPRMEITVVLPHLFSGEEIARIGDTPTESISHVKITHRAKTVSLCSGKIANRLNVEDSSCKSSSALTDSVQSSMIGKTSSDFSFLSLTF